MPPGENRDKSWAVLNFARQLKILSRTTNVEQKSIYTLRQNRARFFLEIVDDFVVHDNSSRQEEKSFTRADKIVHDKSAKDKIANDFVVSCKCAFRMI